MDEFESLQAIKAKQAELVIKKRGTSSERRKYKIEHRPNTEFETVFGEKTDAYIRFFQNSDIARNNLRDTLRCLHLASCFLRHTPYCKAETHPNDEGRLWFLLSLRICTLVEQCCKVELNHTEIETWRRGQ